jgi:hypothetical protein
MDLILYAILTLVIRHVTTYSKFDTQCGTANGVFFYGELGLGMAMRASFDYCSNYSGTATNNKHHIGYHFSLRRIPCVIT